MSNERRRPFLPGDKPLTKSESVARAFEAMARYRARAKKEAAAQQPKVEYSGRADAFKESRDRLSRISEIERQLEADISAINREFEAKQKIIQIKKRAQEILKRTKSLRYYP